MADELTVAKANAAAVLNEAGALLGLDPLEVVRDLRDPENRPPVTEPEMYIAMCWVSTGSLGPDLEPDARALAYVAWAVLYDEDALLGLYRMPEVPLATGATWDATVKQSERIVMAHVARERRSGREVFSGRSLVRDRRPAICTARHGRAARPGHRSGSRRRATATRDDGGSSGEPGEPPAASADGRQLIQPGVPR